MPRREEDPELVKVAALVEEQGRLHAHACDQLRALLPQGARLLVIRGPARRILIADLFVGRNRTACVLPLNRLTALVLGDVRLSRDGRWLTLPPRFSLDRNPAKQLVREIGVQLRNNPEAYQLIEL